MQRQKIVLVVAHQGYQPIEYAVPKKILENAGYTVVTASNKPGIATAKDNSTTTVDILIQDINVNDYAGIFFIGGPGALEHLDNTTSYDLLHKAMTFNLPLGAICAATRILAKAGVLKQRSATGWDGDGLLADIYKEHTVLYIPTVPVVVDGLIVTATGPEAAHLFAQDIITVLHDEKGWN